MEQKEILDVAIIGSGPAGLTAAIYTSRGAAKTVIFGGEAWGGQLMLTTTVDNWPGSPGIAGPELMQKMREHSTMFGAEFREQNVDKVELSSHPFKLMSNGQWLTAKSIIVATGAETRWLGVAGEDKLRGKGVSSCAPCDAPFFKNKDVAVVGGGDAAMEEALVLTKYAKSVTIIHRRDQFKASKAMQKKVFSMQKQGKVKIIWNTEVVKMNGENKLESLSLSNQVTKKLTNFPVDGVFVAIGHLPATNIFKGVLELDEKGYIRVYDNSKTSIPGVFVSGDVHDHRYKQAITAAGYGCQAALEALKYLDENK